MNTIEIVQNFEPKELFDKIWNEKTGNNNEIFYEKGLAKGGIHETVFILNYTNIDKFKKKWKFWIKMTQC